MDLPQKLRTAYSCGDPAARDGAIALILLTQDGASGADSFFSLCTERLKGMFISFFPGEERNEPKKEATDRNKFACVPGRSDAQP